MRTLVIGLWIAVSLVPAWAADAKVDPTFLYRHLPSVQPVKLPFTTPECLYRPGFGEGDQETQVIKTVARFGNLEIQAGRACGEMRYPRQEQILVVLDGEGTLRYDGKDLPLKPDDFAYLPPGVPHTVKAAPGKNLRAILMGFHIPPDMAIQIPAAPQLANMSEVKKQVVGNHPPSTLYQLLIGTTKSTRDRIAAAHVATSLFTMTFTPGGTNTPHHHPTEEEVYILLEGEGDMVAGGGMNGVEGRHPAKPGDAYFIRLNATVGFYASEKPGAKTARILAVRSTYPFGNR